MSARRIRVVLGRRHDHHLGTLLVPVGLHLGLGQDLPDLGVEQVDDRLRRSRRSHQPGPAGVLVARHASFRDRRDVGESLARFSPDVASART